MNTKPLIELLEQVLYKQNALRPVKTDAALFTFEAYNTVLELIREKISEIENTVSVPSVWSSDLPIFELTDDELLVSDVVWIYTSGSVEVIPANAPTFTASGSWIISK